MTRQNVIEAQIKAKASERDRISLFGPTAVILASIPVFLVSPFGLVGVALTVITLIIGIMWANARSNRKSVINGEIEVLMAELEDA